MDRVPDPRISATCYILFARTFRREFKTPTNVERFLRVSEIFYLKYVKPTFQQNGRWENHMTSCPKRADQHIVGIVVVRRIHLRKEIVKNDITLNKIRIVTDAVPPAVRFPQMHKSTTSDCSHHSCATIADPHHTSARQAGSSRLDSCVRPAKKSKTTFVRT